MQFIKHLSQWRLRSYTVRIVFVPIFFSNEYKITNSIVFIVYNNLKVTVSIYLTIVYYNSQTDVPILMRVLFSKSHYKYTFTITLLRMWTIILTLRLLINWKIKSPITQYLLEYFQSCYDIWSTNYKQTKLPSL